MKRRVIYLIVFILFSLGMFIVISFFVKKYNDIDIVNRGKALLTKLYDLDSGEYSYNNGKVSNDNSIFIDDNFFIDGTGKIEKDKYGNVRFYINMNNGCVYKTSMGNVKTMQNECNDFVNVMVKLIKNNNKISFSSMDDNLEYKISNKDDFIGEWIKEEYSGNIIINKYNEGDNYIWFKDTKGNISDAIKFNISCLNSSGEKYNNEVFYCSGSSVIVDNIEWIVIKDDASEITLMMKNVLENKMAHCSSEFSKFCYYTDDVEFPYKWSNSIVNDYLNTVFINELSSETKNKLVTKYICDEYTNNTCNDQSCGGYKKEFINNHGWSCTNYSASDVRIISFDEYNYIYGKIGENKLIKGTYLMMNMLESDKASIVDSDYGVYIMEDLLNPNKIRPVITLKK